MGTNDWVQRQDVYPTASLGGITALFAFVAAFELTAMAWYWTRRHTDVIAARSPYVMLGTMACGLFGTILEVLPPLWDTHFYCQSSTRVVHWLRTLFLMGQYALPFWCCLRLISKFETQRLRLGAALREQGFDAGLDANCFQRHVNWLTSGWTAALLAAWALAPVTWEVISPVEARVLSDPTTSPQDLRFCYLRDSFFNTLYLGLVITVMLLAFKIRSVQDAFQITFELKVLGVIASSHIICTWSLIYRYPRFQDSLSLAIYYALLQLPLAIVTFCLPLRYSYRKLRAQPLSLAVPPEFETLAGVLASKPGRASFQTHLMHEFSLESLLFLTDVDDFRRCKPSAFAADGGGQANGDRSPSNHNHNHNHNNGGNHKASSPHHHAPMLVAVTAIAGSTAAIGSAAPLTARATQDVYLTTEQARDRAVAIYKKYVAKNAPFEINLSHRIVEVLHRELGPLAGIVPAGGATQPSGGKTAVGGQAFRRNSAMVPAPHLALAVVNGKTPGGAAVGSGANTPNNGSGNSAGGPVAAAAAAAAAAGATAGAAAVAGSASSSPPAPAVAAPTAVSPTNAQTAPAAPAAAASTAATATATPAATGGGVSLARMPSMAAPGTAALFVASPTGRNGSGSFVPLPDGSVPALGVPSTAVSGPAAAYVVPNTVNTDAGAPVPGTVAATASSSSPNNSKPPSPKRAAASAAGPAGPTEGGSTPPAPIPAPPTPPVLSSSAIPDSAGPSSHGGGGSAAPGSAPPATTASTSAAPVVAKTSPPVVSVAIDVKAPPVVRRAFGDDKQHSPDKTKAAGAGAAGAATVAALIGGPAPRIHTKRHSVDGGYGSVLSSMAQSAMQPGGGRMDRERSVSISSHATAPVAFRDPRSGERDAEFYLTIFDSARDDVWGLLEADSFARYQNSALFVQLLQSVALADQLADKKGSSERRKPTNSEQSHVMSSHISPPGGAGGGGGGGGRNQETGGAGGTHKRTGTRKGSMETPGTHHQSVRHILVHGSQKQLSSRQLQLLSPHGGGGGGGIGGGGGMSKLPIPMSGRDTTISDQPLLTPSGIGGHLAGSLESPMGTNGRSAPSKSPTMGTGLGFGALMSTGAMSPPNPKRTNTATSPAGAGAGVGTSQQPLLPAARIRHTSFGFGVPDAVSGSGVHGAGGGGTAMTSGVPSTVARSASPHALSSASASPAGVPMAASVQNN